VFVTLTFQVIVPGADCVRGSPVLVTVNWAVGCAPTKFNAEIVEITKLKTTRMQKRVFFNK
jgi:hypothetical protein